VLFFVLFAFAYVLYEKVDSNYHLEYLMSEDIHECQRKVEVEETQICPAKKCPSGQGRSLDPDCSRESYSFSVGDLGAMHP
jgi:hypothetical protein